MVGFWPVCRLQPAVLYTRPLITSYILLFVRSIFHTRRFVIGKKKLGGD